MIVIAPKRLREHWEKASRGDSEGPLKAWLEVTERSDWHSFVDVKEQYRHASMVANDRVVFNIAGNKYRLVVLIHFNKRTVYIRFIGSHDEYDKIDVTSI